MTQTDDTTALHGIIPALVTPFTETKALDLAGLSSLTRSVLDDGVDGLIAAGCTGESWALSEEERDQVIATIATAAGGRVPVIANASGQFAEQVIERAARAKANGADVVMVSAPWYVLPGPDEVAAHFDEVLDGSPLPVLLYNIPRRAGVALSVDLIDRLADHPNVAGIKESSKDWNVLAPVIRRCRARIPVFAGYAGTFGLAALTEGAAGYMDSGTQVFGRLSPDFLAAVRRGDLEEARRLQIHMASLMDAFFSMGTFPSAVKTCLELIGRPAGPTRAPIRPLNAAQKALLAERMHEAGFITESHAA